MDLVKVGEVWESIDPKAVNEQLKNGWVLLTVKVVDAKYTVYVLGKPREKPKTEAGPDSLGPHGCNQRE